MRLSTVLILGGASICALVATSLTATLLKSKSAAPIAAVAPVVAPVREVRKIVVAARPLPFGAPVTSDALKEVPWPENFELPGTYSHAVGLALERRTVISAIAENEPVVQSRLSAPGQLASFSALIRNGFTAVAIRVDDVLGVAGLVQPEDQVNVLLTQNLGAAGGPRGDAYSVTLVQNVRVLAVDQAIDRARQAKPARTVTLEVDLEQAQKLTLAASVGQLSLVLRGSETAAPEAIRRVGLSDIQHRPEMPKLDESPKSPERPKLDKLVSPSVTVTRGTDRKTYDVIADGETEVRRISTFRRDPGAAAPADQSASIVVTRPDHDTLKKATGEDEPVETPR